MWVCMSGVGWGLEDPPRGDPRPRPVIRGQGRGRGEQIGRGVFRGLSQKILEFRGFLGIKWFSPSGTGTGRGHK